jgi:hypothetical protein
MSVQSRLAELERIGLTHPRADAVTSGLFHAGEPFFLAADKVQVKYEMLRAVFVDGATVMAAAAGHGGSVALSVRMARRAGDVAHRTISKAVRELGECDTDTILHGRLYGEFVVAAPQVLHEGVSGRDGL